MIPDGYRVVVAYDSERQGFVARVPELGLEESFASSRAEAMAAAEKKIEEAIRKAAENGEELPQPLDAEQKSGEIKLTVSSNLHRELEFMAREQGGGLEQLCSEILAAAASGAKPVARAVDSRPARERTERPVRGRGPRPASKDYFNILDDKASFLEYVRSLEGGKGGRRGGGRGRE